MMDYRKDHSDLENALMGTKFNKDINDMQNLKLEITKAGLRGLRPSNINIGYAYFIIKRQRRNSIKPYRLRRGVYRPGNP